jgi:hypothetical protein
LGAGRVEIPIVVGVLVVVTGDLLLLGTLRVSLNVRVEETATISHVLDRSAGTKDDLQRTVLSDAGSLEVGLEQGAHLSVARATLVENSKVHGKGEKVDEEGDDDKSNDSSNDMGAKGSLDVD